MSSALETSSNAQQGSANTEAAGRARRLSAWLLDAVLVPTLTLLLVMMTGIVEDAEDFTSNGWMLEVLLLAIASYLLLNGYGLYRHGQTLGKRSLGLAIVSSNGGAAPFWKLVCIRALFFPFSYLILVPPIMILPLIDHLFIFGKRRRCLHDLAAGTEVVRLS